MNFKLALAAAAVVGLAGTAQAADLAKKAPAAANYVKICDAYGAGYFYIPGSETCLKIGGYVRAELRTGNGGSYTPGGAPVYGINQSQRTGHAINTRARVNLNFDARTSTEMGLLRSYIEMWITNSSAQQGTTATNMEFNLRQAFVQFGGLTAGRAASFFDFVEGGYTYGNTPFEPDNSDHRVNLFAYTFSFGNGISASLSLEDKSTSDSSAITYLTGYNTYVGGVKYPDLVANVNISQAWGRAQVMAALRDNYGLTSAYGDKWGYAVGAGVEVNLPMLGAGDMAFLQAAYTEGALEYVLNNVVTSAAFSNIAVSDVRVNATATGLVNTKAWSVSGGLKHNFSKAIEANLSGSYAAVDTSGYYTGGASAAMNDFHQYVLGGNLVWKPVSGLSIGADVGYKQVEFSSAAKTTYGVNNVGSWMGTLRVQRSF